MAKKVLIVDDEEDILTSMRILIEGMGFEAKTVNNGKIALERLQLEKFDLVLLDMLMPEMTGREVLKRIRADKKLKDQKVVFLTVVQLSEIGKDVVKRLRPAGYINKPIDIDDFRAKIKKILG